ncbi:DUF6314 family protein [Sinomonas sp. ASV322]|uniref:DUF6314 family protein n=1 Tax=Sinomonas sp. ASV322 TaxID=3041920 RepID=UPI0027DB209C|nr:DUF6314 family protein [Sinomonas sp. ASV322]MDQ4503156.1 DUF6314 family protein [Sinomonas sp. ASV322]
MSYTVSDLSAYLRGEWAVERTMLDRTSGERGTFSGTVTFTGSARTANDDDGALLQHEEGTVRWGAHAGPATRSYVWRPGPSPESMDVFFPDGRFFHSVQLGELSAQDASGLAGPGSRAEHWCDPDTYRVAYTPVGPDELRYAWDVTGPAKNLLLTTTLRRQIRRV